jgi:hypothetical protein
MALKCYATLCVPNMHIHQGTVVFQTHDKITAVSYCQQYLNDDFSHRNVYILLWRYSPSGP